MMPWDQNTRPPPSPVGEGARSCTNSTGRFASCYELTHLTHIYLKWECPKLKTDHVKGGQGAVALT